MNRRFLLLGALLLLLAGCARQEPAPEPSGPAARQPGLYATLDTSMGKIVIQLFEAQAPQTVANFVALATGEKPWRHPATGQRMVNTPYFDGVPFHRVIPNFMVQTGDPTGTGSGGPGYTIPDEIVPTLKFDRPGRLGVANEGRPHTGSAQFFITHRATPHLDGGYSIFGQVVEGQDVVNRMAAVKLLPNEMGEQARPETPILLLKVTLERVGPAPAAPAEPAGQSQAR